MLANPGFIDTLVTLVMLVTLLLPVLLFETHAFLRIAVVIE
jgi:hypothetical protein